MQRSTSSSYIIAPMRPVRPPARVCSSQINMPDLELDMLGDSEKGEKLQWRIKAEQAVHLIPLVLLLCLLVLYICSTVPINDLALIEEGTHNQDKVAGGLQIDQPLSKPHEDPRVTQLYTAASRQLQYEISKKGNKDISTNNQSMFSSEGSIKFTRSLKKSVS